MRRRRLRNTTIQPMDGLFSHQEKNTFFSSSFFLPWLWGVFFQIENVLENNIESNTRSNLLFDLTFFISHFFLSSLCFCSQHKNQFFAVRSAQIFSWWQQKQVRCNLISVKIQDPGDAGNWINWRCQSTAKWMMSQIRLFNVF